MAPFDGGLEGDDDPPHRRRQAGGRVAGGRAGPDQPPQGTGARGELLGQVCGPFAKGHGAPEVLLRDAGGLAVVVDDVEDPARPDPIAAISVSSARRRGLERRHLRRISLRELRYVPRGRLLGEARIRLVQRLDDGLDAGHGLIGVEDSHARSYHQVFELRRVTSHHPRRSKRCRLSGHLGVP